MIVSPGRRYVFVHIPKTGGTSMALALEARAMKDDVLIGDTPKALKRGHRVKSLAAPGRLWKHARLADIDGADWVPPDAFVFTLVRNPWDRMASLWHWSRQQDFDHSMIAAARALDFPAFLAEPSLERAFRADAAEHYVTGRDGALRCDAFLRLEHLAEDLAPLAAHLGFRPELPHVNASHRPATSTLYTDAANARVADLYAREIDRFGYRFPR
jgi:hypothetical protein